MTRKGGEGEEGAENMEKSFRIWDDGKTWPAFATMIFRAGPVDMSPVWVVPLWPSYPP